MFPAPAATDHESGRRRRGRAARALLLAALTAFGTAAEAAAGGPRAVVLHSVENMYSRPSQAADVTSQALLGQTVRVLETRAGFARVETPDAYQGWLTAAALRRLRPGAPAYATRGQVAEVVSLIANLYREADVTTARPVLQATLGVRLELASGPTPSGWHALRLPSGASACVHAGDVAVVDATRPPPRADGLELVATARRLLGLPYLWGGMSPLGLDCSGYVAQVYRVGGMVLPRDADLQFDDPQAQAVERDDLRPGDLVFFGPHGADGKARITHVGLYAGAGRFLHATTHLHPRVQESGLDEAHWQRLYRGARRRR